MGPDRQGLLSKLSCKGPQSPAPPHSHRAEGPNQGHALLPLPKKATPKHLAHRFNSVGGLFKHPALSPRLGPCVCTLDTSSCFNSQNAAGGGIQNQA